MSKKCKEVKAELSNKILNFKVLKGANGAYLYVNDVMVAVSLSQKSSNSSDILYEFNTSILDLPGVKNV